MPQPTVSQVHVNSILTNLSVKFMQDASSFVADRIFPAVNVAKQSDLYYVYNQDDLLRDQAALRAPATESAGGGYTVSTDQYACKVYAWHKDISDQERANYDNPLDPDRDATEFVTQTLLIKREKDFVSNFFTTNVWTTDILGVSATPATGETYKWNDYTNGDPIQDIDDGMTAVLEATGWEPNTLVLGYRLFKALKNHPDIIDRVKYVQNIGQNETVKISASALANLFFDGGQGRVVVMKAIESTANEGQTATAADRQFIGGNNALLCYAAPSAGLSKVSAGYTFNWTGLLNGGGNMRIKKFYMNKEAADRVEGEMAYAMKKVSADLGYFFSGMV